MKKWLLVAFIAVAGYQWFIEETSTQSFSSITPEKHLNSNIESAYKNKKSDVQVSGNGTVIKVLKDDLKGIKHQRFILRISSQQTILVAHNIDLSSKISSLASGDKVEFYGEYEWNAKGGVVHWTHHDPGGNHIDGWLKHKGKTYQ